MHTHDLHSCLFVGLSIEILTEFWIIDSDLFIELLMLSFTFISFYELLFWLLWNRLCWLLLRFPLPLPLLLSLTIDCKVGYFLIKANVIIVFPSPIWSARIPPRPLFANFFSTVIWPVLQFYQNLFPYLVCM